MHGMDRTHAHCACAAWPAPCDDDQIQSIGGWVGCTHGRVSEWSVLYSVELTDVLFEAGLTSTHDACTPLCAV